MLLSPVSSKIGGFSRLLALTLPTDVLVGIIRGIYVFTKTIHLISVRKKMKLIKLLPLLAMIAGSSFAASPESTVKASGCLAVNDMLENLNSRESCVSVDITRTLSEGRYLAVANLSNGNIYPVRMTLSDGVITARPDTDEIDKLNQQQAQKRREEQLQKKLDYYKAHPQKESEFDKAKMAHLNLTQYHSAACRAIGQKVWDSIHEDVSCLMIENAQPVSDNTQTGTAILRGPGASKFKLPVKFSVIQEDFIRVDADIAPAALAQLKAQIEAYKEKLNQH